MKFVGYAFLMVFAAAMVTALIIGTAFKVIGLLFMAALVVLGVTWIMGKVRGPKQTLRLDHPVDAAIPAERLTR